MTLRIHRSVSAHLCFVAVLGLLALSDVRAAVTWSGGNTTWDQPDGDSFSATYNSGDYVGFGDTGVGTVTVTGGGVTPGAVSFANTAGTYTVSGGTIGGSGLITKAGAGTVQVNTSTDILANSGTGGIGLSVQTGTFYVRADSSRTYTFFGNSATAIQIDGGTFSFRPNSSQNTLANAIQVTANGGTLDTQNAGGNGVRTILGGSLALGGNLTWQVAGAGTPPGTAPYYRDNLNGTVTLDGNRKLTLSGTSSGGAVSIGGNITQDASPRKLTIEFSSFGNGLILSGDNTGLTGGIDLALVGGNSGAMARFASANAMGGGGASSISVPSQTAAGFDFAPTATDLARIKNGSAGMVMLGVNSSQDIDFSASGLNADMRLGACPGTAVTYTGTLTPNGSTYRIGGGGGTLTLSNTNALTGSRAVIIGAGVLNEPMSSGVLVLSGTNNYTGTTTVNYSSGGSYPLKLGINNALPVTTTLSLGSHAGVDLDGYSQEVAGYSAYGFGVRNLNAAQSTFTINRATDDLGMYGVLNNNIAFAKKGAARLVMRSNQSYTGPTTVLAGRLQMFQSGEGALPATAMTVDGSTAILDLKYYWSGAAWSPTFSSLTLANGGTVTDSGTSATLTATNYYLNDGFVNAALGSGGAITKSTSGNVQFQKNTTVASVVLDGGTLSGDIGTRTLTATSYDLHNGTVAVDLVGGGSVTKSTAGTATISSSGNAYNGTTTVSAGTLLVNGSLSAGGGMVTVESNGTLGGTGTINRAVVTDGTLAPGVSPGVLNLAAGLTMADGATLAIELGGTTLGLYDQANVTGAVALGAGASGTTLTLALFGGYTPAVFDQFVIVKNDGSDAVSGLLSYSGTLLNEGDRLPGAVGGKRFAISYRYDADAGQFGTGNDVLLQVIPEPASAGLLMLAGLLALRRQSRNA